MAKRLPVPKELQHLIEKREAEDRRRQDRRAKAAETPSFAVVPGGSKASPSVEGTDAVPPQTPPRRKAERRGPARRKGGDK